MAPGPPKDPPPEPIEADGIDDEDSFDDENEDIVTRLHVMPETGVTGPYAGAVIARKYLLKGEIAKGGMGSVWRALDMGLERPVAIKFMDPRIVEDEELKKRFAREAKAAARLTTPHVVQVYEYGIEGGIPFIAMELLEGEDLHERLKREGPIDLDVVSDIVSQIARGLRSAQDAKVVHRDLKPQNIFLADEGGGLLVKILDFGVAKIRAAAERGDETKAGTVLGSPHYMSPEQARGRPEIDHRADIWSLGVIAFRALTGKMAFPGDAPGEVILRICTDPIPVPTEYNPALPKVIDEVFDRVLEREPESRYQSALEFAAALERVARMAAPQHRAPTTPMQAFPDQRMGVPVSPADAPPVPAGQPVQQDPGHGQQAGAMAAAALKQATPWPNEGTPASAIQAAQGGTASGGASTIQSVQHSAVEGGTPSSAIQPLESPPLDQAPEPAVIKRGGATAEPVPEGAQHAAGQDIFGTPMQHYTPAPGSTPGAPVPSEPGTPQSPLLASPLPYEQGPSPSPSQEGMPAAAWHESGDAFPVPASSDQGPDSGPYLQPMGDSGEYPGVAGQSGEYPGVAGQSGEYPGVAGQSGEHPSLFADDTQDDIEAPTVVASVQLPPGLRAAASPPNLLLPDEELDLKPQRGLSVIAGVAAAAVVLLLIASVLVFGRPNEPETDLDYASAPIPSTLLDEVPPADTSDEPEPTVGPLATDTAETTATPETTSKTSEETSTAEEQETSTADAEETSKAKDDEKDEDDEDSKKPRRPRPRRPRPSDEWGY